MSQKRCWAEIDLSALRQNARVLKEKAHAGVMAIVKANAYGHGLVPVAQALQSEVAMFGVANVSEGLAIREAGVQTPVFILGPALEGERPEIVRAGFIPAISSYTEAAAYDQLAKEKPLEAHLVIDTGMGRMGVWQEEALEEAHKILTLRKLRITGVATHLPSSDEEEGFTQSQIGAFERILEQLRLEGLQGSQSHVLNSAGVLRFPGHGQAIIRAGLALYGCSPLREFQGRFRPAMAFKASVTLVREMGAGRSISYGRTFTTPAPMRVATVAAGYADGYQRHLSGSGVQVLVGGVRCPVLGRVTMDQICVDVSAAGAVSPGDEVVLFGTQGKETIPASELAAKAGTIPWEIFTGIGARVQRIYRP